ncbi:hypothetical protein E3N88_30936 [Mikania micrantha]|uniref:GAF domain-containing protein n=1 Tax=Mikania micrantha TaxID=192012 RepID=A0A5N6MNU7_9ASTR|nr:hypothetical protein E3N88_30936 [Mikania micrantha]
MKRDPSCFLLNFLRSVSLQFAPPISLISSRDLCSSHHQTPVDTIEAMNSQDHFNIMVVIICQLILEIESVLREVFGKFNFCEESGLLQFWACRTDPNSEEIGCNLVLTHLTCNPTQDQGLEDYRKRCLEKQYPFIGIETSVGNWLAGRAAQTGIADHMTIHHVVDQDDQHSADVGARGQLVLPVFFDEGAGNKLAGVIEYATPVRKESYVEDFDQIKNLLKDKGLKSTYMRKTIKVVYNGDEVLRDCMKDSSSKGANFIKMHVSLEHLVL